MHKTVTKKYFPFMFLRLHGLKYIISHSCKENGADIYKIKKGLFYE
jgi:hypothetical protein